MPQSKNKHIIFVEKNNHPSRFLLDLNNSNSNSANNTQTGKNRHNNARVFDDVFTRQENHHSQQKQSGERDDDSRLKHEEILHSVHRRARKLTFFPLLLLAFELIRIVAKICYGIGLVVVFLVRLPLALPVNLFRLFSSNGQQKAEVEEDENKILYSIYKDKIPQEKLGARVKQKVGAVDWLKPIRILMNQLPKLKPKIKIQSKPFFASHAKVRLSPKKLKFEHHNFKWPRFKSLNQPLRTAGLFALSMMILVLPFKLFTYYQNLDDLRGLVLGASESAVASIKDGAELASNKDFYGASANFAKASQDFSTAQKEVKDISELLAVIAPVIPNKDIKMAAQADLVLEAGRLSSKIAENLSLALSGMSGQEADKGQAFANFFQYSQILREDVKKISEVVQKIEPDNLPDEYREKFSVLQGKMIIVEKNIDELADLADKLYIALGFNSDKRYLIVFQNNTEMRASGGFIGSYALVDFSNGQIKNIEVPGGGSYDTEWGMVKKIVAPEALSIVNPRWYFWDANWWPDWPTSARKLEWFYEQSERRTVDGVISLTPTAFEKILSVIGPIDMQEKYGLTFTAENFWELTQSLVEQKPAYSTSTVATSTALKNEPKKIIGDLLEKIRQELPSKLNQQTSLALLQAIEAGMEEKHILAYFNEGELEQKAVEYNVDGGIKNTNWDYLMVVDSNVAGGKSDKSIKEEISHTAEIQSDGTVVDTVMIKRTHLAAKNQEFIGVRNNDWLRVYVPLGSELIEARGFSKPDDIYFSKPERDWEEDSDVANTEGRAVIHTESGTKIYEENSKTVFANWSQVDPGSYTTIYFKYKLPFRVKTTEAERVGIIDSLVNYFNPNQKELLPYALLAQKQPGSISTALKSQLILAGNYKIVWSYRDADIIKYSGWSIEDVLNTDKYFATLITEK